MDVRGSFKTGLGKSGNELVALFNETGFAKDQKPLSGLVKNPEARIDLQGMFINYGKRWANLQIQKNGTNLTKPTTFAHLFLQAGVKFPINVIRNAFKESMLRCVKVWLEVSPRAVPQDL